MKTAQKESLERWKKLKSYQFDPTVYSLVHELEKAYNDTNQHAISHLEAVRDKIEKEWKEDVRSTASKEGLWTAIELINEQLETLK